MGILRVYLALCVIASHSNAVFPWGMHDGREAVEIFYIISGFYMAMVLSSRYANPRDFYVSRIMRIFPPYWVVFAGTLVLSVAWECVIHHWLFLTYWADHPLEHNGVAGLLFVGLSNITLIGQDWVEFVSNDFGHPIHFTENFHHDASPLFNYLLVPQCWTVAVELTFYAFAPYLNRLRSRWLAVMALTALAARLIAYRYLGMAHDPWNYRFFPFELSLFLFGMLAYRLYARTAPHHPSERYRCVAASSYVMGAAILLFLFYISHVLSDGVSRLVGVEIGVLITYPFWALAIPVLFFAFGKSKLDRNIGELSYPVYLLHFTILAVVANFLNHFKLSNRIGICTALLSLLLATFFYRLYIAPLDKKRHLLTRTPPGPAVRA